MQHERYAACEQNYRNQAPELELLEIGVNAVAEDSE
jgi:hypothetical protein